MWPHWCWHWGFKEEERWNSFMNILMGENGNTCISESNAGSLPWWFFKKRRPGRGISGEERHYLKLVLAYGESSICAGTWGGRQAARWASKARTLGDRRAGENAPSGEHAGTQPISHFGPPEGRKEQTDLILQHNSVSPHTTVSSLNLSSARIRFHKHTHKETDGWLCALPLVPQRKECGPRLGDCTITTSHITLRLWALPRAGALSNLQENGLE